MSFVFLLWSVEWFNNNKHPIWFPNICDFLSNKIILINLFQTVWLYDFNFLTYLNLSCGSTYLEPWKWTMYLKWTVFCTSTNGIL